MLRRKRLIKIAFMALLAAVTFLWPEGSRRAAATVKFTDINGHWAETSMLELSVYGIIQGYPDGQLKPDRSVSMLEVIKMILETVGLSEAVKNANLSGLSFSPEVTWGKEYLAVALQKGMLTKQDLQKIKPDRPATRAEVAYLLGSALGFKPDYNSLNFVDTGEIDEKYRGYVGSLAGKGIIKGLPGNIFAPGMEISRAQICTMLFRLIEEGIIEPPSGRERVVGLVAAVNPEKKTLIIRNITGENEFAFLPDILLMKKGEEIKADSLNKDQRIKLIVDAGGKIHYAAILDDPGSPARVEEGFVLSLPSSSKGYSLILETETGKLALSFLDDALLVKEGEAINVSKIKEDSYVEAGLDGNGRILELNLYEPRKVTGTIIDPEPGRLRLKVHGIERTYQVSKNVQVTKNIIRNMAYQELKKGDRVEILFYKDKIFHIDYLANVTTNLSGMISKVQKKYIYIYDQEKENRYQYDEGLEIFKKDELVDADELKRGDYVFFEVNNEQKVIYIEVIDEEEGELEGVVKYLFISSQPSITLIDAGGLEIDYNIDGGARFFREGDEINLEDIIPGTKVQVKIEDKKVAEIKILDDLNIITDGRVTGFNEEGNRLTLEINGRKHTYGLSGELSIIDSKKTGKKLSELEGHWIRACLVDGNISKIEIL